VQRNMLFTFTANCLSFAPSVWSMSGRATLIPAFVD
jgi:hypothetical protein